MTSKVEPVGVHHLGPGSDEVLDELLFAAFLGIDFGGRSKLTIRAKDQIGPRRPPFLLASAAVVADELLVSALVDHLPEGVVVEKIDEEVVGQRSRSSGEDAVFGLPGVGEVIGFGRCGGSPLPPLTCRSRPKIRRVRRQTIVSGRWKPGLE